MLANECFGGRPPRVWERIISRSTSSIPECRYGDIDAFTQAIRHRHYGRIATWCGIAAATIAIAEVIVSEAVSKPVDAIVSIASKTNDAFSCDAFGTNASTLPGGFATWTLNGKPGAKVCLDNCVLINRTTNSVTACGVRYVIRKGSYLNFINLDRNEQTGYNAYMEKSDVATTAGIPTTTICFSRVSVKQNYAIIRTH